MQTRPRAKWGLLRAAGWRWRLLYTNVTDRYLISSDEAPSEILSISTANEISNDQIFRWPLFPRIWKEGKAELLFSVILDFWGKTVTRKSCCRYIAVLYHGLLEGSWYQWKVDKRKLSLCLQNSTIFGDVSGHCEPPNCLSFCANSLKETILSAVGSAKHIKVSWDTQEVCHSTVFICLAFSLWIHST